MKPREPDLNSIDIVPVGSLIMVEGSPYYVGLSESMKILGSAGGIPSALRMKMVYRGNKDDSVFILPGTVVDVLWMAPAK